MKNEKYFQPYMEKYLGGKHKKFIIGESDITNDDMHAELKNWSHWKSGVGQLIIYSTIDKRPNLYLYLFGNSPGKHKQDCINTILKLNIKPFEMVLNDNGFDIIELENDKIIESIITISENENNNKIFDSTKIESFINDLNKIIDENKHAQYPINLDIVAKWLHVQKSELVKTLHKSYTKNEDYTEEHNTITNTKGFNS